ncbi:MAG: M14 family zinc carboxypeptidase [Bacteroidota bacterium]
MSRTLRLFIPALLILSCAGPKLPEIAFPETVDTSTKPIESAGFNTVSQEEDGLQVDARFPGARLKSAEWEEGLLRLTVAPENSPIDSCAYYAFKITSDTSIRYTLELEFEEGTYCYRPWTSWDGYNWKPYNQPVEEIGEGRIRFALTLNKGETWVSAAPLASTDQVVSWASIMALHPAVAYRTYGLSSQERDLFALEISEGPSKEKPIIAMLARQHPAEVNGYHTVQKIVEAMIDNNPLANAFRKEYRVLVFPLVNPDGVDLGHWKHSAGGVDLHQDWSSYRQPEVRDLATFLYQDVKGQKSSLKLLLDFHATEGDRVFRLDPALGPSRLPIFTDQWLSDLKTNAAFDPEVSYLAWNQPITIAWAWKVFRAESVIVEMNQGRSRASAAGVGTQAGNALMDALLKEQGRILSPEELKSSLGQ